MATRTIAPLFRPAAMQQYFAAMASVADELIQKWRTEGDRCREVDSDMTDATAAIIMRTMLSSNSPEENQTIKLASASFISGTAWEGAYRLMNIPAWIPNPGTIRIRKAITTLRGCMATMIARKRCELTEIEQPNGDLISLS
jgi:cytochrome P450